MGGLGVKAVYYTCFWSVGETRKPSETPRKHEENMKDPRSESNIETRTFLLWDISGNHWSIMLPVSICVSLIHPLPGNSCCSENQHVLQQQAVMATETRIYYRLVVLISHRSYSFLLSHNVSGHSDTDTPPQRLLIRTISLHHGVMNVILMYRSTIKI